MSSHFEIYQYSNVGKNKGTIDGYTLINTITDFVLLYSTQGKFIYGQHQGCLLLQTLWIPLSSKTLIFIHHISPNCFTRHMSRNLMSEGKHPL